MKTDRLIVVARMIGTYGIILGYFVTLHVSTLFGAMLNVIFELLALPFYVKNKIPQFFADFFAKFREINSI